MDGTKDRTIDLNIRAIEAIAPPTDKDREEYRFKGEPGLVLRVTRSGVKTFSFVGRAKGSGRLERVTLGKFRAVLPDEAKKKARQIAAQLARGESAAKAVRDKREELTLAELLTEYVAQSGAKHPEKMQSLWRLHMAERWGNRKLSEVTFTAVAAWHRKLPEEINRKREAAKAERLRLKATGQAVGRRMSNGAPVEGTRTANQCLRLMHALYRWAIEKARLYKGDNPAHGVKMFKETARERFLQPGEMTTFFAALAAEPNPEMRDFVMLALLTGARRQNVCEMRWQDLDLTRGEWRIPDTKNGEPQAVPLVPEAASLLKARREALRESGKLTIWVLPANSKSGHLTEPRKGMERMLRAAGIENLTIHDLRRTLGSWQARAGASLAIIGKSLGHKSPQSTKVYARLDLDPVRASTERATTAMLEAAGLKESASVVELGSAKGARTPLR